MTSLTHTPAHTSIHPDRFEDETTGWGYSVLQDVDAEDLRTWVDDQHAALWVYREPHLSHSVAAERPDNWIVDAFAEFYQLTGDDELALKTTKRWLWIFHPEDTSDVETRTIRGYSQSDWLDVVAVVESGYGTAAAHIDQFRMWAFGDVWTVVPDRGAGVSGIYASDAEAALAHFREHFEDEHSVVSTTCDRHGGPWGSDETCPACTDAHGLASIDPDWLDDIDNVRDADHVDVAWTARDARGRVTFSSDMTLTADQAAAMFRGIGENS